MTKHAPILGRMIFRLLCWGVPHVPKIIDDGPIKWLLLKEIGDS
jgi:hypothetical protein